MKIRQPCSKCGKETLCDAYFRNDQIMCAGCAEDFDMQFLPNEYENIWVKPLDEEEIMSKRIFKYRFWGGGESELREIKAFLLSHADEMARELADLLSRERGYTVHFSGPVDFYEEEV